MSNNNGNGNKMPKEKTAKNLCRGLPEILEDLHKEVPDRLVERRGDGFRYIPWYHVCRLLEYYAPGWTGEVKSIQQVGQKVIVVYQITIRTQHGSVVREATGEAEISEANATCLAEAQAFKRAAAKLGIGIDLYQE